MPAWSGRDILPIIKYEHVIPFLVLCSLPWQSIKRRKRDDERAEHETKAGDSPTFNLTDTPLFSPSTLFPPPPPNHYPIIRFPILRHPAVLYSPFVWLLISVTHLIIPSIDIPDIQSPVLFLLLLVDRFL